MSSRTLNILSILCGVWFLLTSWIWIYFINLFISFPFGLLGIFFWHRARKIAPGNTTGKVALILHVVGALLSATWLIMLLINN